MTTQTTLLNSATEAVNELKNLVYEGLECWSKAGKVLVSLLDDHGYTYAQLQKECGIDASILSRFEMIGRRQLHPPLLVHTSAGHRQLAKAPYSTQVKYCDEPVEVLVLRDGQPDVLCVKVGDLTTDQCRQVFGKDGNVRDIPAQRAYLASKNAKSPSPDAWDTPYAVKGKNVVVSRPCTLDAKTLANLLARLA